MAFPLSDPETGDSKREREELERAMAALESQRALLGEAAVEAALTGLRARLGSLDGAQDPVRAKERIKAAGPIASAGLARKAAPESPAERKLVTVMFADLSGFTALSERLDPEKVRSVVNSCFDSLVPIVRNYGGTVDKFMGDEIMALFGAPEAHEDDPERAIRAALEMRDRLSAFNASQGTELGMHFGINTGLVVAGMIGSAGQSDYSVMGDAVNLASRLEDASERDDILVGADTFRLASGPFEFGAPRMLELKGKEGAVSAYLVLGLKAETLRRRGFDAEGFSSPLVGREAELGALHARLEKLSEGEGGLVCLVGEAGLGKSRLLDEARKGGGRGGEGGDARIRWLEGHAVSFGRNISYWPFQEILRAFAGIGEELDGEAAWARLERAIAEILPGQVPDFIPFLASLLSLPMRGEYAARLALLDAEAMSRQIFLVTRRFFEALALSRPLVLVFEDLHWMDDSSMSLLEHILPLASRLPLLVFCLSRPEDGGRLLRLGAMIEKESSGRFEEILLRPLSAAASEVLARNLLSCGALSGRLRNAILGRAEGNPFYVEEVLRALKAMGALSRDPRTGQWSAVPGIEGLSMPDTIQGVIMARVDRLDEEAKEVLRAGSVIGRSFLYRILAELPASGPGCGAALAALMKAELIDEKARIPELEYIFRHALTQEATYESILLERRKELHALVGAAIERIFAARLEVFYSLLSYHYARAEIWEKAQDYLFKAGDQAGKLAADSEALSLYQQALEAYSKAFGNRWDPFERAVMERKIAEVYYRRGDYEKVREIIYRVLALSGYDFPQERRDVIAAIARGAFVQILHRLFPRRDPGVRVGEIDRNGEEILKEAALVGWTYILSDQLRALLFSLWSLNLSERKGWARGIAIGSAGMSYLFDSLGMNRIAMFYGRRALRYAERSAIKDVIALAFNLIGMREHFAGAFESSIAWTEKAILIYEELGELWGKASVFTVSVAMHRLLGDCQGCIPRLRSYERQCRDSGDINALPYVLHGLGHLLVYAGPLDEAVAALEEAAGLYLASTYYGAVADARSEIGFAWLRMGRLDEAIDFLEEVLAFIHSHGIRGNTLTRPCDAMCEAYLAKAESLPPGERKPWLAKAAPLCSAALRQGRIDRSGWLPALRYRARLEWLRGHGPAARRWWNRALKDAASLKAVYETGICKLEMGERLGLRDLVEEAVSILKGSGASLDLGFARAALERLGAAPLRPSP